MSRIFISYRRGDSKWATKALDNRLSQRFGDDQIFMDVATIRPGQDFVRAIETAVGSCSVLIAVIGTQWVSMTDDQGKRRLHDPNDYVRLEVATALKREILVIPVLIDGAGMPRADELPADLAMLTRRNALEVSEKRFDYDVDLLIETLEKELGAPSTKTSSPPTSEGESKHLTAGLGWARIRATIEDTFDVDECFVREPELGSLVQACKWGNNAVAYGEAGSGKTTLLQRLQEDPELAEFQFGSVDAEKEAVQSPTSLWQHIFTSLLDSDASHLDMHDVIYELREALHPDTRYVLLIDNVDALLASRESIAFHGAFSHLSYWKRAANLSVVLTLENYETMVNLPREQMTLASPWWNAYPAYAIADLSEKRARRLLDAAGVDEPRDQSFCLTTVRRCLPLDLLVLAYYLRIDPPRQQADLGRIRTQYEELWDA